MDLSTQYSTRDAKHYAILDRKVTPLHYRGTLYYNDNVGYQFPVYWDVDGTYLGSDASGYSEDAGLDLVINSDVASTEVNTSITIDTNQYRDILLQPEHTKKLINKSDSMTTTMELYDRYLCIVGILIGDLWPKIGVRATDDQSTK